MKKIINLLTVVTISLTLYSCTKDDSTNNTTTNPYSSKEDPNSYFTATFLGKTLKTSGIIIYDPNVACPILMGKIVTQNGSTSTYSTLTMQPRGSEINTLFFNPPYNFPFQSLDAFIFSEKNGNALGNYKITNSSSSEITDLFNSKQYNFDTSTIFTVTSIDVTYLQGTYTGKLIDGTTKIPVTGTFKLKKN